MSVDILIVEDHPTMRKAMRAVLEQEGHELRDAANGREALEAIAERKPDVVFLDLHMPGITGEQVLRTLKGDPQTNGIKVVIVTAVGEEGRAKVIELGADEYFSKPFSPIGLLETVARVVAAPASTSEAATQPQAGDDTRVQ